MTLKVVVRKKELEAADIFRYELASVDGTPLPAFAAGAHIDVHIGPGIVRQYSLCNHPVEEHRYVIGVLREAASRGGSEAMHRDVQEGNVLTISAPKDHFPLHRNAVKSILIAGGIGVTPLLCMAQRLAQIGAQFAMHYCARSLERMAFRTTIEQATFAPRVFFHLDDGPEAQRFNIAEALGKPEHGTHIYVCGPRGFMDRVIETAGSLGWDDAAIHREYFAGAMPDKFSDRVFRVKIASTGQIIPVPANVTVVSALEQHGIAIPVSCEQGVCGTCLTRILDGVPDHRDLFLTDAEHAVNDRFTPCCSRAKSDMLVLDL